MMSRGSEWRRWDLHVHTPDTALEDNYGSWDEYIAGIVAQSEVRVIGVTDYFLFDNYGKLKGYRESGALPEIDLLIPNIEFRIAPPTDKATALNIHLLVSPEDPNHQQEIHNALARLTWEYGGKNYSCIRDQLIDLGKAYDPTKTEEKGALAVGVTGVFQGSCRVNRIHYATLCITTSDRSGLSMTAPMGDQSRVSPDQRSGCMALAA
jgi:hypothetical protein